MFLEGDVVAGGGRASLKIDDDNDNVSVIFLRYRH